MKKIFTAKVFFTTALPMILFFGFVGVVSGSFTEPGSNPPNGNVSAPLNTSAIAQTKSGNLWADNIIAEKLTALSELCLGSDCRSTWGSQGSDFSTTCTVNRRIVASPQDSPGIPHYQNGTVQVGQMAAKCDQQISTADRAAGWMLISFDNCPSVSSRDCAGASYCYFIQLQCDAGITTQAGRY